MRKHDPQKLADLNGNQYHIHCRPGDLAKYLLVPGDPDRVTKITSFWEESKEVGYHREFRSFTGKYKGASLSAMSSGIGTPCIAIVVNEAAKIGVETFIRVGSTGAIQKEIDCGDLVISTAAVRQDGTSNNYVTSKYPAVADYEVLQALIEAAEKIGVTYHVGVTATTSDFYAGQARSSFQNYWQPKFDKIIKSLQKANVLNFEMECATLFVLSTLFKLRAGAICAVYANRCTNTFKPGSGEEDCIKVANEAVKLLSIWDEKKRKKNKKWLFPSLLT
jgi:uridine phosphorylase